MRDMKAYHKPVFIAGLSIITVSLSGCLSESQSSKPSFAELDAIGKYERMREETNQTHTHVQYCDNDIVKLTISSRGELATRDVYVPRRAVVQFRNRDTLNQYPLGVLLYKQCLSDPADENCSVDSQKLGVNVSLRDTAKLNLKDAIQYDRMAFYGRGHNGLYKFRVKESWREKPSMSLKKENEAYTSFPLYPSKDEAEFPSLYVSYRYHEFMRPDIRRCSWSIVTDEAIRTSRASHCDDLSDWEKYVSEFNTISDKISKEGEFAHDCRE